MSKPQKMPLPEAVVAIKKALKIDNRELARRVGVDPVQVRSWARGATVPSHTSIPPLQRVAAEAEVEITADSLVMHYKPRKDRKPGSRDEGDF